MFCPKCGYQYNDDSKFCIKCGTQLKNTADSTTVNKIDSNPFEADLPLKNQKTALWLCFWLGIFGAHDFYMGKIGKGIIKIILLLIFCCFFELGIVGLYVWILIDAYKIVAGTLTDKSGRSLNTNASDGLKKCLYVILCVCIAVSAKSYISEAINSRTLFSGWTSAGHPELVVTQRNFDSVKNEIYVGQYIQIQGCIQGILSSIGVNVGECDGHYVLPSLTAMNIDISGFKMGDAIQVNCTVNSVDAVSLICE